jgi:COMPASS component SWD1
VAAIYEEQPYLVDISEPADVKQPLPTLPRRIGLEEDGIKTEQQAKEDAKHTTTSAIYTASGSHIIAGTTKGWINIIDAQTREIIYSEKICNAIVTTLRLTSSGRDLLVNAQDRIIRTFHMPNLAVAELDLDTIQMPLEHKFQDVVNKLSWNHVTFSSTGDYVAASTFNSHEVYIWERGHGSLVRMLEDSKEANEEQGVIEWHPYKALLAACGMEKGVISIWSVTSPQRWSALAPDFVEVEENVEYVEREDEFDIHPQEEINKRRLDLEDEDVDVLGVDQANGVLGEDVAAFQIPVLFNLGDSDSEEEFIKAGAGTFHRKSDGDAADDSEMTGQERASSRKTAGKGKGRKK